MGHYDIQLAWHGQKSNHHCNLGTERHASSRRIVMQHADLTSSWVWNPISSRAVRTQYRNY